MRDIRQDLMERLDAVDRDEREFDLQVAAKKQEFAARRGVLRDLLRMEGGPLPVDQASNESEWSTSWNDPSKDRQVLEGSILKFLADGQPKEHAVIRRGMIDLKLGRLTDANFGRVIQGTLMSLRSRGLVELVDRGTWKILPKEAASAA